MIKQDHDRNGSNPVGNSSANKEGALDVPQAVDRLQELFNAHHAVIKCLAGRLISIPEYEIKLGLAHRLYFHAEAARAVRNRLSELRIPKAKVDAATAPFIQDLAIRTFNYSTTPEFLSALRFGLIRIILAETLDYIERADQLLDMPSVRVLKVSMLDLQETDNWLAENLRCMVDADPSLETAIMAAGRDIAKDGSPHVNTYPSRAIECARDSRFKIFSHTRQYPPEDFLPQNHSLTPYEQHRLNVVRTQRDEIDAVETFANILFDFERPPFDLEFSLARFIWDEARHSEMGQRRLGTLGYDPFSVPCGIIGINVRSPMHPLMAFAQINTFGEVNQVGGLRRLVSEASRIGDVTTAREVDFVHADEMTHVRVGREWLRALLQQSGTTLEEFEEEARIRAVERLQEEGIVGEEYGRSVTAAQLAEMLGE